MSNYPFKLKRKDFGKILCKHLTEGSSLTEWSSFVIWKLHWYIPHTDLTMYILDESKSQQIE